jgi:hypothetical protein
MEGEPDGRTTRGEENQRGAELESVEAEGVEPEGGVEAEGVEPEWGVAAEGVEAELGITLHTVLLVLLSLIQN